VNAPFSIMFGKSTCSKVTYMHQNIQNLIIKALEHLFISWISNGGFSWNLNVASCSKLQSRKVTGETNQKTSNGKFYFLDLLQQPLFLEIQRGRVTLTTHSTSNVMTASTKLTLSLAWKDTKVPTMRSATILLVKHVAKNSKEKPFWNDMRRKTIWTTSFVIYVDKGSQEKPFWKDT